MKRLPGVHASAKLTDRSVGYTEGHVLHN